MADLWTRVAKPTNTGASQALLLESGSFLLLEDGTSHLLLEQASSGTGWTKVNKPTS